MRICRFSQQGKEQVGLYQDDHVVPLSAVAAAYAQATGESLDLPASIDLLDFLPPAGTAREAARRLAVWLEGNAGQIPDSARLPTGSLQLHVPIPRPNKLLLLAGNYASHIEEGGGTASERQDTFPYVFMKPPSTTLTDPGGRVTIPAVSPNHIDWECELAVVIGQRCKGVKEADALKVVAGYTVIVDVSDRKFRPNSNRKERDRDRFFDWQHGKWHDSFCPCGPCIASADELTDPQSLPLKLSVNGTVQQDASTAMQIFPVAAVIEFISSFVTLEPGDIISTGTAAGVGSAKGIFLKPGDTVEASIGSVGTLRFAMEA